MLRAGAAYVCGDSVHGHDREDAMAWFDDAARIQEEIAELRAMLDAQPGLSADARATVLSTVVSARATLLAVETFQANKDGVLHDFIGPLTTALKKFPESAVQLAAALERMPEY